MRVAELIRERRQARAQDLQTLPVGRLDDSERGVRSLVRLSKSCSPAISTGTLW